MPKPVGGRGKKANYETMQMRVPVPIKPLLQKLIDGYRDGKDIAVILNTGLQSNDSANLNTGLNCNDLQAKLETCENKVKELEAWKQQAKKVLKEALKAPSNNSSLIKKAIKEVFPELSNK